MKNRHWRLAAVSFGGYLLGILTLVCIGLLEGASQRSARFVDWRWLVITLGAGYSVGIANLIWFSWSGIYCPRCRFYIRWRDALRGELKEPWHRQGRPTKKGEK